MAWEPAHRSPEQSEILGRALAAARPGTVGVFDLDGCLFDNRHRQIHIIREYASREGVDELYVVGPQHFVDWDLERTLRLAGLPPARAAAIFPGLRAFWMRRFFTSEYAHYDHAMPGAAAFVRALAERGMAPAYLTGRGEAMRAGTLQTLAAFGFPEGPLEMKQDPSVEDEVAKGEALGRLGEGGELALFLDNEPANVNLFRERSPSAVVIQLLTDHSGRPIPTHPDIPRVRGFLR
jgi:hypothetical protein